MKIVVGVDDSDASTVAVRRARILGEQLKADLDVVFVAHVPASVLSAMSGLPAIGDDFADTLRKNIWKGSSRWLGLYPAP